MEGRGQAPMLPVQFTVQSDKLAPLTSAPGASLLCCLRACAVLPGRERVASELWGLWGVGRAAHPADRLVHEKRKPFIPTFGERTGRCEEGEDKPHVTEGLPETLFP